MFSESRRIQWEYEDQLEIEMTTGMFIASRIVDGVRMYPFVSVDSGKYYLEGGLDTER